MIFSLIYCEILSLMLKRKSKALEPGNNRKKKGFMTNEEKAEHFTRALSEEMFNRIEKGEVAIGKKKKIIEKRVKKEEMNPLDHLESIEESLKSLRVNIKLQKEEERQLQKIKLVQAHELIVKMKKQKEENKRKIMETEERSILHSRIFSDSTISKMRKRLEERVETKKKEIEERLQSIAARKNERDQKMIHQQIQYWQKIKKVTDNNKSSHILPSVISHQTETKRNSVGHLPRKRSFEEEEKAEPYSKKIDLFLEKVKNREKNLNLKQVEKANEERRQKIVFNNQKLLNELADNTASNEFLEPVVNNKSKMFGDQYLKESLLRIKKKDQSNPEVDSLSVQQSMELKAKQIPIHQNQILSKMKEKWDRILSRIQHHEVEEDKGLELLNSLERRLDKIDKEGITNRLKKKVKVLEGKTQVNESPKQEKEFEPATPSFDHQS